MYISIIVELNYKNILLAILYIHQFTFISSSVNNPTLIRELYRIKKKKESKGCIWFEIEKAIYIASGTDPVE